MVLVRKADHGGNLVEGVGNLGVGGTIAELDFNVKEMRCSHQDGTRTTMKTRVRECGVVRGSHSESRRRTGEQPDILQQARQPQRWQMQTCPQRALNALPGGRGRCGSECSE